MQAKQIIPILPTLNLKSLTPMAENEIMEELSKLSISDKVETDFANDFPFLNDDATVNFIKSSKVMFIMRGLPGSGKSSLAKQILSKYGDKSVLCSGDLYFTDPKTGEYKFDANKLQIAHQTAQDAARDACRDSISPVIIDNTNVSYWEIKPYVQMANKYDYMIIICEPRTPWKFDIDVLCKKNSHNVPRETIRKKLQDFKPIIPLYFGWFLNENESKMITEMAFDIYSQCLKASKSFLTDIMKSTGNFNNLFKPKANTLHCTARYCGKSSLHSPSTGDYLKNPLVSLNNGKHFPLQITAFTITHQTIGAQVLLNDDLVKLNLWDNDLSEDQINEILDDVLPKNNNKNKNKNKNTENKIKFDVAARAHITIALANGIQAVQTGYDLISILAILRLNNENNNNDNNKIDFENYEFIYLDNCRCYIKFKKPLILNSVFSLDFF